MRKPTVINIQFTNTGPYSTLFTDHKLTKRDILDRYEIIPNNKVYLFTYNTFHTNS